MTLEAGAAGGVEVASVVNSKISVFDRSILERPGAEGTAFQKTAPAHVLGPESCVHPRRGSQIKSITQDEAFARGLADVGDQEARLADFAARRGRGVGKPDERNAE